MALETEVTGAREVDLTAPKPTTADFLLREKNQQEIDKFTEEQAIQEAEEAEAVDRVLMAREQRQQEINAAMPDIEGTEQRPTTFQQPITLGQGEFAQQQQALRDDIQKQTFQQDVSRETAPGRRRLM